MRAPIITAAIIAITGCTDRGAAKAPAQRQATTEPARKLIARPDFRAAVDGKDWNGIVASVGHPDRTTEAAGDVTWFYDGRTFDPTTGRPDRTAQVTLRWMRVESVAFY